MVLLIEIKVLNPSAIKTRGRPKSVNTNRMLGQKKKKVEGKKRTTEATWTHEDKKKLKREKYSVATQSCNAKTILIRITRSKIYYKE